MNLSDCFHLGFVFKPHSFTGEVVAKLDVDDINNYKKMESVFVEINNELVPFFIKQISGHNRDTLILKFDGVDTIDAAEQLAGSQLYLPLTSLPTLPPDKYYFHEIVGYVVIDKTHGNIGVLESVIQMPMQNLLSVKHPTEKEILIPIVDNIVLEVNKETKIITTDAPEGLVELYLE
jgi:16S rRNA processing protein RimM